MKAVKCSECEGRLEAANNEALFEEARRHVNQKHPGSDLGDDQIRTMVDSRAYEKEERPTGERLYSDDPGDESAGTF